MTRTRSSHRVLSLLLLFAMLLPMLAWLPRPVSAEAGAPSGGIAGLEESLRYSVALESEGYIGIPVDIYTYHTGATNARDSHVVLYVINTNTERVGTESDLSIVQSMLDRNYIVVVADYKNHPSSVSPALDWSCQRLRTQANGGQYLDGAAYKKSYTYVVPSGYNLDVEQKYFSFDEHGVDGTFEKIVEIWNQDFTGVKGEATITYLDGTTKKVKEVTAETIADIVKKDGTPVQLDLCMDIIYPTSPDHEVPVMTVYSSSENRIGAWTNEMRPHLTGFLFAGYAGAVFDYGYTPMARTDHYGYFDGNGAGSTGGVTNDNYTYSLDVFNGVKNTTAAIRYLRYMAMIPGSKYRFDLDAFGVYGNSKGGVCTRLGVPNAEELQELRWLPGHEGETRYENGKTEDEIITIPNSNGATFTLRGGKEQPWLTYPEGSALAGQKIPSNVQFVYANCGGGQENIGEGHAPTYASGSMLDGSYGGFFSGVVGACYSHDIPCVDLSFPELGHALVYGTDKDYGLDGYAVLFDMAHYYLDGRGAVAEYINIGTSKTEAETTPTILIKFSGGVSASEIEKVTVTNRATGIPVSGTWESAFGNTSWYFTPEQLAGATEYDITVPTTIICENGAPLLRGLTDAFRTTYESLLGATRIASAGSANTATRIEGGADEGVYYLFENPTVSDSTTVGLRFTVTNDAANIVEVYALAEINRDDLRASSAGELLDEVCLLGAGTYEIDVTEHLRGLVGEDVGFLLKVKKNVGVFTLKNYDFESAEIGATGVSEITTDAQAITSVTEFDGSRVLAVNYMNTRKQKDTRSTSPDKSKIWFEYYSDTATVVTISKGYSNGKLTDADLGRKLSVSYSIYDTDERFVSSRLHPWGTSTDFSIIDWKGEFLSSTSEKGAWRDYSMSWRIDGSNLIALNQVNFRIMVGTRTEGQSLPLYIDNIVFTEEVTEVTFGAAGTSAETALVLHPANVTTLVPTDTAWVESGENAGSVMKGDLLVGGRTEGVDPSLGKGYVKLSLADYEGDAVFFCFTVGTSANRGTLDFYGISDVALGSAWSSETLTYLNAPANDIYDIGVLESLVYDGEALGTVEVKGAGDYALDITRFALAMKERGAEEITLILINRSSNEQVLIEEDFSTKKSYFSAAAGGGLKGYGQTQDADRTNNGGGAYHITPTAYEYERLRLDFIDYLSLTEADLGRTFRLTYYAMATTDNMSYFNSLMANRCSHNSIQRQNVTLGAAGEWQKVVYEFIVSDDVLSHVDTVNDTDYPAPAARVNFEGIDVGATLYIDDLKLEELGLGAVALTPKVINAQAKPADRVIASNGFDAVSKMENKGLSSIVTEHLGYYTASGFESDTKLMITSDEDYTTGLGKSVLFIPNKSYNRLKFYNILDHDLTEADIGRTLTVTFRVKASAAGSFTYGLMSQLSRNGTQVASKELSEEQLASPQYYVYGTPDSGDWGTGVYTPTKNSGTISEEDVGKWMTYSFSFTVTEEMLPKEVFDKWSKTWKQSTVGMLGIIPSNALVGTNIYIDDIVTTEPVTETEGGEPIAFPYVYSQSFEQVENIGSVMKEGGLEFAYLTEDAASRTKMDTYTVSSDTAYVGEKSVKLVSSKSWNRFKFIGLTESVPMAGDTYHVSFRLKADKAGTFSLGLFSVSGDYAGKVFPGTAVSQTIEETGVWCKYSYSITLTQEMIDAGATALTIHAISCGQSMTTKTVGSKSVLVSHDPVTMYVDDLYSSKAMTSGATLIPTDSATVKGSGATVAGALQTTGTSGEPVSNFVKKSYFSFRAWELGFTQNATLTLHVTEGKGQTVSVWGLLCDLPEDATYLTAPASRPDEGMEASLVWGGVPLAVITLNGAGDYTINVTDYVKYSELSNYVFAVTSNDYSGKEVISDGKVIVTEPNHVTLSKRAELSIEAAKIDGKYNAYFYENGELVDVQANTESITLPRGSWISASGVIYDAENTLTLSENITLYAVQVELLDGASIRLAEPTGLRFETVLDPAMLAALTAGGYSYTVGTLIVPTDRLGEMTALGKEALDAKGIGYLDLATDLSEAPDKSRFFATLATVMRENYTRAFSAVSYVEIERGGEKQVFYTAYDAARNARSVYEVACAAYADPDLVSSTHRETVRSFIDRVVVLDAACALVNSVPGYSSPYTVSYDGETLTVTVDPASGMTASDVATVVINGKSYTGGWTVNGETLTARYPGA